MRGDLERFQHGQSRRERDAFKLVAFDAPIEALDQINVTSRDGPEFGIGHVQAAMLSSSEAPAKQKARRCYPAERMFGECLFACGSRYACKRFPANQAPRHSG